MRKLADMVKKDSTEFPDRRFVPYLCQHCGRAFDSNRRFCEVRCPVCHSRDLKIRKSLT